MRLITVVNASTQLQSGVVTTFDFRMERKGAANTRASFSSMPHYA
jgi:hypothetical protein